MESLVPMNPEAILSLLRTSLYFISFFTFLLSRAQLEYPTGTIKDDGLYDAGESFDKSAYDISLPNTYSLTQFTPKVGNQLEFPHDIAWSIASATTIVESVYSGSFSKENTSKLFKSPYFINMLWVDEKNVCEDPMSLQQTIVKLSGIGLPSVRDYIKLCPKKFEKEIYQVAERLPSYKFGKVFDREMDVKEKVDRIKTQIALDRPVIMSFHCPPSFVSAQDFWSPKERMSEEFPLHTVVLIGYDDQIYGGAFLLLNSWSTSWGNDGLMWFRYQDVEFIRYAYSTTYEANEGDNLSILSGNLKFFNTSAKENIPFTQFDPKGYYKFDVGNSELKFHLEGESTKPFYLKMYYKSGGDVSQIYPVENWRSSLFEYTYENYSIPGNENFYQIEKDLFSSLYVFMSLNDIDEVDFSDIVAKSETIIDLLRTTDHKFSRQVVWDNKGTKFSGRLYEGEIIPLILDLEFK